MLAVGLPTAGFDDVVTLTSSCVTVDGKLPVWLDNTLRTMIEIIVSIALIAALLPWFLVVLPVLGFIYIFVYIVFRVGTRRLYRFRLESVAPLLTHVDATVYGLSSVHAYQLVDDFKLRSYSVHSGLITR